MMYRIYGNERVQRYLSLVVVYSHRNLISRGHNNKQNKICGVVGFQGCSYVSEIENSACRLEVYEIVGAWVDRCEKYSEKQIYVTCSLDTISAYKSHAALKARHRKEVFDQIANATIGKEITE